MGNQTPHKEASNAVPQEQCCNNKSFFKPDVLLNVLQLSHDNSSLLWCWTAVEGSILEETAKDDVVVHLN